MKCKTLAATMALAALTLPSVGALAVKPAVELTFDKPKIGPGETANAVLKVANNNYDAMLTASAWAEYDDTDSTGATTHVVTAPVSVSVTVDGSLKNPVLKAKLPAGVTVVAGSLAPSGTFVNPVASVLDNVVTLTGSLMSQGSVETLAFLVKVPRSAGNAVQTLQGSLSALTPKER